MPIEAMKENDRILDEMKIKTDSYVSGAGLRQPVLKARTIAVIRVGLSSLRGKK